MSDRLRQLLADTAAAEERRFASEHQGDDTGLYERAIAPRRGARRALEAGAGLLAVVALAIGGAALADGLGAWQSQEPASTEAPSVPRLPRSDWTVQGHSWEPGVVAAHAVETWDLSEHDACAQLPGVPHADGVSDPSAIGGFEVSGAAVGLESRVFDAEQDAQDFASRARAAASECAAAVGDDYVATVSDVSLLMISGAGDRLDIAPAGSPYEPWRLWVQVEGAEVLVVFAEPGGQDLVSAVVVDWFTGAAH